jgi:hypothetical protein
MENFVRNSEQSLSRNGRNGGKLRSGNPGNKGGGRRPDQIRALARTHLEYALNELGTRIHDPNISLYELLRATDLLMKYGVGPANIDRTPNDDSSVSIIAYLAKFLQ